MEIREEFEERGRVLEAEIRYNTEIDLYCGVNVAIDVDYDRNIDDNDGLRPQTTALLIII